MDVARTAALCLIVAGLECLTMNAFSEDCHSHSSPRHATPSEGCPMPAVGALNAFIVRHSRLAVIRWGPSVSGNFPTQKKDR